MERKTIIFILLVISALALSIVSIWLLADTTKIQGISLGSTDAPKVGITAGLLAAAVGIAFFYIKDLQSQKNIMLAAALLVLIFGVATFGVALKERLDIKKAEDLTKALTAQSGGFGNQNYGNRRNNQPFDPFKIYDKLKTQLIVLIVAGVVASICEIAALILLFTLPAAQATRNPMPTEKPY